MKTQTTKRFLSLLLVMCMLIGLLGVIPFSAFAADTSASGTYAQVGTATSSGVKQLLLYRDFEDGLSVLNGCTTEGVDVEIDTADGNSFYRYNGESNHTYMVYDVTESVPKSGALVFQFDIMLENPSAAIGSVLAINPAIRGDSSDTYTIGSITYGNATNWGVFNASTNDEKGFSSSCGSYTNNRQLSANTWYTVTYVFTGTDMVNETLVTCYFNGSKVSTTYTDNSSTTCTDVRPGQFRFGGSNATGLSYCVDDIIIYTSSSTDAATAAGQTIDGSKGSCGAFFNAHGAPNVNPDQYNGNYFFKVGALTALNKDNTKVTINEAPFSHNGNVYIPVSALQSVVGTAPAGATETVNGISCVNINNIHTAYSSLYASYSSMGLIGLSTSDELFVDGAELTLLPVMQKFLFDNVSSSLTKTDSFDASDLVSTDHPYLFANQNRFDELADVWAKGQAGEAVDATLYDYINNRVSYAQRLYDQYAQTDASGNYLAMNTQVNLVRGHQDYVFEIPYQTTAGTGGYDVGGRLNEAASNNERILALAYGYQITKNINFAKLAYQYATYMGQWEHWGPGHFLNVADASSPYATAYDWLYDAWATLESEGATYLYFNGTYESNVPKFDTKTVSLAAIESVIFTHSILPGYYSINDNGNAWHNPVLKTSGWGFYTNTNNWNAVCSAGMTVSALALVNSTTAAAGTYLDLTIDGKYNATTLFNASNILSTGSGDNTGTSSIISDGTYQDYAEYLVNNCLYYLPINGLEQYVPDGSYIESNAYWSYGTNNLFEMAAALTTSTGHDYGLLDAWGLDRTAYYAINTMSSDGQSWNYHDSTSVGPQDTSWFMYLATSDALGDTTLAGIRKDLNAKIKQDPSYYDSIFYLSNDDIGAWEYPDLEYYMEGVDGYVVRDSWDKEEGNLYAAFMGNSNNISHGQIDSGSFIYYNKGTRWFCDIGTEEYNAYGFWAASRYRYYAMGGEGNNNLIITSEPDALAFGQALNGFGSMYANGNNESGAYAIIDNTLVYGGIATSAKRGMLFTNDRKTVVIQDEASFTHAVDTAWIAHTLDTTEIMLSVDGTVAYMSNGTDVIRVTLIDNNNSGLKFSIRATDTDPLLDCTLDTDFSINNGGVAQKDFSGYNRLVVEATGITSLNIAVVIEEVLPGETMNDAQGIGYSFVSMDSWVPTADNRDDGSVGDTSSDVATITVTVPVIEDDEPGDTPIVDLFDTAWPAAATFAAASSESETTVYTAATFEELENYINSNAGNEIVVDLKASNDSPITINVPCTVNTNGNKLLATSSSLVANVSGNTTVYEAGSITVSWKLANGSTVTETYTSSTVASYKGTIVEGTTLYEIDNGDGTYSYYTSGNVWSLTENGNAASSNNLIVTSANNTFYQVGREFDGLFVTVTGSTVTGYYTANDFFSSTIFGKKYDRVSVTNDFGYDATAKADVHSTSYPMNLYLNGNTITFTSSDTSDHMFIANGGDFNVYGPGGINSQAESSNMFYNDVTNGDNIYVENADLYSVRAIIDLRCNTATFKNCNIIIEKNASAFTVINRNNAAKVAPYLYVDGCTVNLLVTSSGTAVVSMNLNAKAELTGGTSIITATDCTLFQLNNSTVGTVDGFDYTTSYNEMYAILGTVYHNLSTISKTSTNDTSGATYDLSGRVFYGEGYLSTTDPSTLNVLPGLTVAKRDESTYILAKTDECATVVWADATGNTIELETWIAGSTPVASSAIKSSVSVASGKMLTFAPETVAAGGSYTFKATVIDAFGLQINMSLHTDFNINFFVENIGAMTFKIDGEEVTNIDTASYAGYYKISKYGINPAMAGKAVKLEVTYNGSTISKSISPIDYVAKVLSTNAYGEEANAMMINILKYTEAAYVYVGNNVGEYAGDYSKIIALYNEYKDLATVSVVDRQGVDMSAVTDAINGAQLNLAESPKFRFNLKSSYTGNVTIGDKSYAVENGVYGGKTYIELTTKAYELTNDIVVTTANGTATYNLANYYYYEVTEHGALANLLNALFAYCETSAIYQNTLE